MHNVSDRIFPGESSSSDNILQKVESEVPKEQVIVTKDKPVIKGYTGYEQHHYITATALNVTFGVVNNFSNK